MVIIHNIDKILWKILQINRMIFNVFVNMKSIYIFYDYVYILYSEEHFYTVQEHISGFPSYYVIVKLSVCFVKHSRPNQKFYRHAP